jgi:hypothetical protein
MAPHEPVARIEALYRKRTARKCQEKTLDGTQGRTLQAVSQEARFVPKAAISFFDHLIGSYGRTETSVR